MFIPFSRTPLTVLFVAVSILVYFLQQRFESVTLALLIAQTQQFGLIEIEYGEFYRLITPIFLHFGLAHIAFNSLLFLQLGQLIEWRFGSWHFVLLTLLLALLANLFQYYSQGPYFGGLSGVIYGFFGFIWIQGRINKEFRVRLPQHFIYLVLGLFIASWLGIFELLFGMHIANMAHTAGLVGGIALAVTYYLLNIRCKA